MNALDWDKLNAYVRLLGLHRGEARAGYDAVAAVASEHNPLTHLLGEAERPFHHCDRSRLIQFAGGLTTVAMVATCYPVTPEALPCAMANLSINNRGTE